MNQVCINNQMAQMKKIPSIFDAEILAEGHKHYIFKLRNKQVVTMPKSSVLGIRREGKST